MTTRPLRFGIWALVHGSRAAYQDPDEPYDASWERNRDLVLAAERLGYDSTLIAQHTINPHQEDLDQLEAWSAAAAIAALTSRIEIIAAIKPYLYHPVVLAKLALGIENISRGRFAINLVNAWNRPELDKAGIGFPEHDARYAYGREWISVVSRLMQGERLTYKGEHFDVRDYVLGLRSTEFSGEAFVPALRDYAERFARYSGIATSVVVPPGGVVVTSTATDLYDLTATLRSRRGPVAVFNPAGLGGVASTLRWSPLGGSATAATC